MMNKVEFTKAVNSAILAEDFTQGEVDLEAAFSAYRVAARSGLISDLSQISIIEIDGELRILLPIGTGITTQ